MSDEVTLTINLRDGGEVGYVGMGDVLESGRAFALANRDVSLDELYAGFNAAAETLGMGDAIGYTVAGHITEQGGSGESVEIIIELVHGMAQDVKGLGWDVLAGLVLKAILDELKLRRDDDD